MKKISVTALGELLVDFTQDGTLSKQGNPMFEANPGGAPCNVLAMLQKLGRSTAFIGKVGNDFLGKALIDCVREAGINTDNILTDPCLCAYRSRRRQKLLLLQKPGRRYDPAS